MQEQAIQGYFNNGNFYQQGRRVVLPERQIVIVNVLDVPVDIDTIKNADIDFWKEFDSLAEDSFNEELQITDFPRVNFKHELLLFENEATKV